MQLHVRLLHNLQRCMLLRLLGSGLLLQGTWLLLHSWQVLLHCRVVLAWPGLQRQAAQCLDENHVLIPASNSTLQRLMLAPELGVDCQELLVLLLLVPSLLLQGSHLVHSKKPWQ